MAVTGVIERTIDINHGVIQEDLHRLFAVADAQAHTFKITVNANGVAQSLSGHTVIGYFMRNAGGTVVINGSVSGNVATLVLPQSCYSIIGGFQLIIRLVSGNTKTAIYWASGYITRSTTDPVVDPGNVVPDLNDLLAKIDQMEQATEAANTAATNANTAAEQAVRFDTAQTKTDAQKLQARNNAGAAGTGSIAPAFSDTGVYAAGDMVTQGGKLYKFTSAHAAGSWTGNDATEVSVSEEISSLKEDLSEYFGGIPIQMSAEAQYISLSEYRADIDNPISSGSGFHYAVVPCVEGDVFQINAVGGASARAWGFLDSQKLVLSAATENTTINQEMTAPSNSAYLVINDKSGQTSYKMNGDTIPERVSVLESDVVELQEEVDSFEGISDEVKQALLACFEHVAWIDGDGQVYYDELEAALIDAPETYATVLFNDGTLIINERGSKRESNITKHGIVTAEYPALDDTHNYSFTVDTSNFSSTSYWYENKNLITSVEIGSRIAPTKLRGWFCGLSNCTSIKLPNIDVSNVTNARYAFYGCSSLTSIDTSKLVFSSKLSDALGLFRGCSSVERLDMSTWDFSNVYTVTDFLNGCSSLQSVTLPDLSKAVETDAALTGTQFVFKDCSNLVSIDLSRFNTSKSNNFRGLFDGCARLTEIDISNFDVSLVTNTVEMFKNCSMLRTIKSTSNLNTSTNTNSANMFLGCTSLVGGNGTTYNSSYVDKTRARIDGGTSSPGYFTAA